MAKLAAKVYGDALFAQALEKRETDVLLLEVKGLKAVWEENPRLSQLLDNPKIGKEEKHSIVNAVFDGRISIDLMGFLKVVVEKGRQKEIPAICEHFINKVMEYKNAGVVKVISAAPLKEEQKASLLEKLLATTPYVEFETDYQVDPSLIGGMIIRIGDRVVDSSIKTRIDNLRRRLLKLQMG